MSTEILPSVQPNTAAPAPTAKTPAGGDGALARLLDRLTIIETPDQGQAILETLETRPEPAIISFLNAHAVNLAMKDGALHENLTGSTVLFRDGIGVKLALATRQLPAGLNMNGTDLIPAWITQRSGRRIALYGTVDPFLARAALRLTDLGHHIVDLHHGFGPLAEYVERVRLVAPDWVILGMGMPKQEQLAQALRDQAVRSRQPSGLIIINGGAVLDFMADRFPRAPLLIRRLGLEWLFRLLREPRRLFRRYVLGNLIFLQRVALSSR